VKHPKHKGKFALALALLIDKNLNSVVVPSHISEMFAWLYDGTELNSTSVDDLI
jgi:putative ATP-dependent endonuclease of OLD family